MPVSNGVFVVDTSVSGRRQVFEGIQVELMADSIGSYNEGMPGDGKLVPDNDTTTLGTCTIQSPRHWLPVACLVSPLC
jgi:hypothetical protein